MIDKNAAPPMAEDDTLLDCHGVRRSRRRSGYHGVDDESRGQGGRKEEHKSVLGVTARSGSVGGETRRGRLSFGKR
eukprot:756277-Hanusia_phi.AAC.1